MGDNAEANNSAQQSEKDTSFDEVDLVNHKVAAAWERKSMSGQILVRYLISQKLKKNCIFKIWTFQSSGKDPYCVVYGRKATLGNLIAPSSSSVSLDGQVIFYITLRYMKGN